MVEIEKIRNKQVTWPHEFNLCLSGISMARYCQKKSCQKEEGGL